MYAMEGSQGGRKCRETHANPGSEVTTIGLDFTRAVAVGLGLVLYTHAYTHTRTH